VTKTLMTIIAASSLALAGTAVAQPDYRWHENDRNWDPARSYHRHGHYDRRLRRDDYVYRGHDGRYYCRRNDGTTGLVVGALGGAALGGAIGGDTLGALVGAGAGGLLGRAIDRGQVHCR